MTPEHETDVPTREGVSKARDHIRTRDALTTDEWLEWFCIRSWPTLTAQSQ